MKKKDLEEKVEKQKMKLHNLPLDCSDRQWDRNEKRLKELELELSKLK